MARMARVKVAGAGAYYHLCSRVAGHKGDYPLAEKRCTRFLIEMFKRFAKVYCCAVAGFAVMGNHYHLVVRFDEPRKLSREELWSRATLLYPDTLLKGWIKTDWERFEARIFDVSEFMRNLQAGFARWFNGAHERRGRFWAERFKSTLLENEKELLDCLLYVDLNAVRAGLVEKPEVHEGSSVFHREIGADRWMIPLTELVRLVKRGAALRDYKARLYYRGNVASKRGQVTIPAHVVRAEEAHGFAARGAYAKRLRHFVDGVVLGSEEFVRGHIDRLRKSGQYLRRKHPVTQLDGLHASLREQRSTAVAF
ncbi:MAG: hypothetical protein MUC50_18605 [Myxococcota bacterium]|jgi:REP element-mobilizing transposase RayT|nr:hypothetical protein [Myxococcota bacterium]